MKTAKDIKPLIGKYVKIIWKAEGYEYNRSIVIRTANPTNLTYLVEGSYNKKIKYKDIIEIKRWKEPQCPNCKSFDCKDIKLGYQSAIGISRTLFNCNVCRECGILFINKNNREQCLW